MISPGVTLGGRYRLDERIAGGGMGDVWRATDEVLGRTVAVKILLPALLDEPGFAERFRGEARTMATINHPGVVDVYDYGSDQQLAFLVMEYVEGDALSSTLGRVGRLTPARTMALVAQAADALHAAHANGIVHRDVKPGNLLVRPNGTLVLTDFGIARSALVGQLTQAGAVLGTASYISPEQATGGTASPASDVYALGVVAYQCLSGHRPFDGANPLDIAMKHVRETPRPLPGDIPPPVRSIVERAMAKDPGARWPTAAAMAVVARQAASALSGAAPPQNPPRSGAPFSAPPFSGAPYSGASYSGGAYVGGPATNRPFSGAPASGPPSRPVSGVAGVAGRPVSGQPVSGQSASGPPGSGQSAPGQPGSGHPASGQARPAYPTTPRPTSNGQARGAASVPPAPSGHQRPAPPPVRPSAQPQPQSQAQPRTQPQAQPQTQPQAQPRTPAGDRPGSGGRQVLIVLAVVLALLVLLCVGVISSLASQGNFLSAGVAQEAGVVRADVTGGELSGTSYRSMKQAQSLTHASEGRQTL